MFFRYRSKQRHTARCLTSEAQITYSYHPRCGEVIPVVARKQHAGAAHLVIRQRDGTLSLLPSWMTEPTALSAELRRCPRLPVARLVDLRCLVDALLAFAQGESVPEEGVSHERNERKPTGLVRIGDNNCAVAAGDPIEAKAFSTVAADGGGRHATTRRICGARQQGGR